MQHMVCFLALINGQIAVYAIGRAPAVARGRMDKPHGCIHHRDHVDVYCFVVPFDPGTISDEPYVLASSDAANSSVVR